MTPGSTYTDAFKKTVDPAVAAPVTQAQPIKGAIQPSDIVGAARYFAGDDARFMTGQVLVIDGGRFMPA